MQPVARCPHCGTVMTYTVQITPEGERAVANCPDCDAKFPILPAGQSPVRTILGGSDYQPLRSLRVARKHSDAYLVVEGDYGGQIYLTLPVRLLECSEKTLAELVEELDRIAWAGQGADVYYERHKVGDGIVGGMGGGRITDDLWLHEEFVDLGLVDNVRAVLTGRRDVMPLFDPDLELVRSRIRPEEQDTMALQWASVVILMHLGFYVIWTGRKWPPHSTKVDDIFADITGTGNSLRVRCVVGAPNLRPRLETFPQDVRSMGLVGAKLAVFTNLSRQAIPTEAMKIAEHLGVAILPTETLTEILTTTKSLTAAQFHTILVGGLIEPGDLGGR